MPRFVEISARRGSFYAIAKWRDMARYGVACVAFATPKTLISKIIIKIIVKSVGIYVYVWCYIGVKRKRAKPKRKEGKKMKYYQVEITESNGATSPVDHIWAAR